MATRSAYPRSCFWPRCTRIVSSDRLGCRGHWYALPKALRDRILEHYRPGQNALTCSQEYREALCEVLAWARERQAEKDTEAERIAATQRLQVPLF
jgi:hypothetical protein